MTPIPEEAMPVVEILRLDVERPKELPVIYGHQRSHPFRFEYILGWNIPWKPRVCCPMGLHPKATMCSPADSIHFIQRHNFTLDKAIKAFYGWWDKLAKEDAQEVVDAIWPEEG